MLVKMSLHCVECSSRGHVLNMWVNAKTKEKFCGTMHTGLNLLSVVHDNGKFFPVNQQQAMVTENSAE